MSHYIRTLFRLPRRLVVGAIMLYQKTISPDHGVISYKYPHGFCRFYPSCSEYTKQAVGKYGVVCGGLKGVWRILRCNPWGKGGNDFP